MGLAHDLRSVAFRSDAFPLFFTRGANLGLPPPRKFGDILTRYQRKPTLAVRSKRVKARHIPTKMGRSIVKKGRGFSKVGLREKKQETVRSEVPQHYLFWDQAAGVMQFQADCDADLNCTIERMAGLLAMQCLLGGHEPSNFSVLVPAEQSFQERLLMRAQSLLDEGRNASAPNSLSPRQ
jgi:hypothetical protein